MTASTISIVRKDSILIQSPSLHTFVCLCFFCISLFSSPAALSAHRVGQRPYKNECCLLPSRSSLERAVLLPSAFWSASHSHFHHVTCIIKVLDQCLPFCGNYSFKHILFSFLSPLWIRHFCFLVWTRLSDPVIFFIISTTNMKGFWLIFLYTAW